MYNKQNYNDQNNNQNNYNRPRQDVHNTTVNINNIHNEELANIKEGWVFKKQFEVSGGAGFELNMTKIITITVILTIIRYPELKIRKLTGLVIILT